MDMFLNILHTVNQLLPLIIVAVGTILGKKFADNDTAKAAAQKSQQLVLLAEDLLRLILHKVEKDTGHEVDPRDLKLAEVKVDGVPVIDGFSAKNGISLNVAERILTSGLQKLSTGK